MSALHFAPVIDSVVWVEFEPPLYYSTRETDRLDLVARWDAYNEITEFTRRLSAHPELDCPELAAIYQELEAYHDADDDACGPPDRAALVRMRQSIWELPESIRTQVLNGWRLDPPGSCHPHAEPDYRESRGELERREEGDTIYSGLEVLACAVEGRVQTRLTDWRTEDVHPLQLYIRVGTTKSDVMKLLEMVRAKLESDWDNVVKGIRS